MKSLRIPLVALVAVLTFVSSSPAAMDLILDARPGTLLLGNNTGKFKVTGEDGTGFTIVEECGGLSTFPNVKLGVGFDSDRWYMDVTGAGGVLITDRFRAPLLDVDVSAAYKFRKNVSLGPHLGLIYFMNPEWSGSAEMDITESSGLLGGLQVAVGYDVLFIFSIDYLLAEPFEITTLNGWRANHDEIDFSGLGIQFGIRGRF